jgi:hypothetical protein
LWIGVYDELVAAQAKLRLIDDQLDGPSRGGWFGAVAEVHFG